VIVKADLHDQNPF